MLAEQDATPKPPKLDATPERIAHAGTDYMVGDTGLRRFQDSPLQRLATRGALYPDRETNRKLLEAGERYYADWYLSNMDPLVAFDPTRVFSGGGESGGGMPASMKQAERRANYRAARLVLGKFYAAVIDPVVCQQQELVAVGRHVGGVAASTLARTIAFERLRAGLYMLGRHYGILK